MLQRNPYGSLVLIRDGEDLHLTADVLRHLLTITNNATPSLCIISAGRKISEAEQRDIRKLFKKIIHSRLSFINLRFAVDAANPKYLDCASKTDLVLLLADSAAAIIRIFTGSPLMEILCDRYMNDGDFCIIAVNESAKAIGTHMVNNQGNPDHELPGLGFLHTSSVHFSNVSADDHSVSPAITSLAENTAVVFRRGWKEMTFDADHQFPESDADRK